MIRRLAGVAIDERGGIAVEFALVAPLFILLVVAVLEMGLMLFTGSVIDGAARDAARQVRTGQAQTAGDPLGNFRGRLCQTLSILVNCAAIVFDVRSFPSFTAVTLPMKLDANGNMSGAAFSPGNPGQIVTVRVSYRYPFHTPLVGKLMSDGHGDSLLLMSTVVFRNEPFRVGS